MPKTETEKRPPGKAPAASPSGGKNKQKRFRLPRIPLPALSHRQKRLTAAALFLAAALVIGLLAALRGQDGSAEWTPFFSLRRNELRLLTSEPPYGARNDIFVESGKANTIDAAVYERNRAVEDLLDVKIRRSYTTDAVTEVRRMTLAEISAADLIAIEYGGDYATLTVSQTSPLLDLTETATLDLSDSCYNADVLRDLSLCGRLYAVTGDSLYSSLDSLYITVFDRAAAEEVRRRGLIASDLQDTALAGGWTLDLFAALYKTAPDTSVTEGDSLLALCAAMGERSILNNGTTSPQVTVLSDSFRSVFRRIQSLFAAQAIPDTAAAPTGTFSVVSLSTLGDYLEQGTPLYGILPMPKVDQNQRQYITPSDSTGMQSLGILSVSTKTELAAQFIQALMQENSGILQAYSDALAALDARGGEILTLLKQRRVYDLGEVCRWGNFSEGLEQLFPQDASAYDTVMGERATAAEFSVKLAWERAAGES